jgi:hemolysin activation/secretion protein
MALAAGDKRAAMAVQGDVMGAVRKATVWVVGMGVGVAVLAQSPPPGSGGTPGVAATPSFVPTRPELAPARDDKQASPEALPDASRTVKPPRELGKPDDVLTLDVSGYAVASDAPARLVQALPDMTAAFVGKARTYEDIANAASEVTRYLQRELGYYLGYAYIPEQQPVDGVVKIAILEGRLDHVELVWDDQCMVDKAVVEAYLERLRPGSILTVQEVERAVFLVNDLRGISVRAEVKAGSLPGTAILQFTARPEAGVVGKVDADVNGSRFIGVGRLGGLVTLNSPFGRGDGLSATAIASSTGGLRFALFGYTSPVGSDGLKVGTSVSALNYKLDATEFPLGLKGSGVTYNAFALYPWERSRNLNLFALAAADIKTYADSIAGLTTNKRVDDLNLGLTGDFRDSVATGAVNTFEAGVSFGHLSYRGGLPTGVDDASSFTKLNLAYSRLQNVVSGQVLAFLSMRGQYALNNLDTTEQFRAGGPDGVRAYAPGEGTGDSGVVVSAELRWLPPESLLGRWAREISFAAFFDAAQVQFRHDPNQISRDASYVNHAGLAGAGLSMVWAKPGEYALRLSIAKPTHGVAKSDTRVRDPRLYLQGSWFF